MTNEVEQIVAELEPQVNAWLNNKFLLRYERLVQIARTAERAQQRASAVEAHLVEMSQLIDAQAAVPSAQPVSAIVRFKDRPDE